MLQKLLVIKVIKIEFLELIFLVDDQDNWKQENFEAKIIHIPGHTLGHICFYFYKENSLLLETLFFHWVVAEFLKELIYKCLIL